MPKFRLESSQGDVEYVYVLEQSQNGEHKVVRSGEEVNLTVAEANASGLNFVRVDEENSNGQSASQAAPKNQ